MGVNMIRIIVFNILRNLVNLKIKIIMIIIITLVSIKVILYIVELKINFNQLIKIV